MASEENAEKLLAGFNQYDVLGYLTPGAATVVGAFLYEYWLTKLFPNHAKMVLPLFHGASEFASRLDGHSWVVPLIFFFGAIWAVYILGHVVASVAAVVIDRVLVGKGLGYPYARLLGFPDLPNADLARLFYRCIFFWFTTYLVCRYFFLCFEKDLGTESAGVLHAALTTMGWFLAATIVVKVIASSKPFKRWTSHGSKGALLRHSLKFLLKVACAPYWILMNPVSAYLGVRKTFPPELAARYQQAFSSTFGLDPLKVGTENYWLSYMHVRTNSPQLTSMADNWMRLYSFARNLAAGLYLAFVYCYLVVWLNGIQFNRSPESALSAGLPYLLLAASLVLTLRYYYLYANYYTKFVFRSFVYLHARPSTLSGTHEQP